MLPLMSLSRSLSMNLVQPGAGPIKFMSSANSDAQDDKNLLTVAYKRVQKQSPEFSTLYDGIDQSIDVTISTFIFHAAPEPVVSLYEFIMTTFVPQQTNAVSEKISNQATDTQQQTITVQAPANKEKIRVIMKLASVQAQFLISQIFHGGAQHITVVLVNNNASLATLSLSTADVAPLLQASSARITGPLVSLAL